MTENEAIEWLETLKRMYRAYPSEVIETWNIAIKALTEIQQYRAVGTIEECREAVEKQAPKKCKETHSCKSVTYYQCPCCNGLLHMNENFCGICGLHIEWGDIQERM